MGKPLNVLLTGGNTGIGRATAVALVGAGHRVWIASRSESKTIPVIEDIRARYASASAGGRVEFLALDLADFVSVRSCARQFLALGEPLHVLLANAGLAGQRGLTAQGFELAFGTNHLGHFLLTMLLLPALEAAAPSRVVVVSSKAHYDAKAIDWSALREPTRTVTGIPEYGVSKLCNVLFARELARRTADKRIWTGSLHPGVVASDIWRKVPWPIRPLMKRRMITNEQGAETSVYCASSAEVEGKRGRYWDRCAEKQSSALALDDALASELWQKSELWTRDRSR